MFNAQPRGNTKLKKQQLQMQSVNKLIILNLKHKISQNFQP